MFRLFRLMELVITIPIIGMLAYFVNGYVQANQLTPTYILVLFIVSVLAGAWQLATLLKMDSVRRNAGFVAFVDVLFIGAFIGGVYELGFISSADCANAGGGISTSGGFGTTSGGNAVTFTWPGVSFSSIYVDVNKTCAMLKASFALGIIDILLFAGSAILAVLLHRREKTVVVEKSYSRRGSHSSR